MIVERNKYLVMAGLAFLAFLLVVAFCVSPMLASLGVMSLVVFTLVGLAGALALVRPLWVLYCAVAVLPLWNAFEIGEIAFTPFELVVMFLFFACLLRCLITRRIQGVFFSMPNPWIWAFVAAVLAGALSGAPDSLEAINIMRKSLLIPLAFYLILLALVDRYETVIRILWVFIVANTVIAVIALNNYLLLAGEFRAGHALTSSVFLGLSCACGIAICIKIRKATRGWKRRVLEGLLLIQLACLIFTFTRMAILCLASMPLIYWLLFRMKHKKPMLLVVSVLISLFLLSLCFSVDADLSHLSYGGGSRESIRVIDWEQYRDDAMLRVENWLYAFDVFKENMLFGHGFYPFYKLSNTWRTTGLSHPHSIIFNLLVSSGIVGTLFFMLFFYAALARIWTACFRPGKEASLQRVLFLCLWCMVMNGLMNGIFIWVPVASLFFLFLGLELALTRVIPGETIVPWTEDNETHTDRDRCPYPVP